MIISGGETSTGPSPEHFALDPVTGQWARLRAAIVEPRSMHSAVWTGSQMLEWGGFDGVSYLNSGNRLEPQLSGARIKDLVMGDSHACALSEGGQVKCWGGNTFGQLGLGDVADRGDGPTEMGANLPYVNLGTSQSAIKIALGDSFTCAILSNYSVKCWGKNANGQLGLGDTTNRGDNPGEMGDSLPTVSLGGTNRAIDISAGASHACAVLESGTVKCWGYNLNSQLGDGTTTSSFVPIQVSGLLDGGVSVLAGDNFSCARLYDGLKCWGGNSYGQLGDATTTTRSTPVATSSLNQAPILKTTGRGFNACVQLPEFGNAGGRILPRVWVMARPPIEHCRRTFLGRQS